MCERKGENQKALRNVDLSITVSVNPESDDENRSHLFELWGNEIIFWKNEIMTILLRASNREIGRKLIYGVMLLYLLGLLIHFGAILLDVC